MLRKIFDFSELLHLSITFDNNNDSVVEGSGIVGTLREGADLVTDGKYGKAVSVGQLKYVDFGIHDNSCVGNISACHDGLTIALWVKLLKNGNSYIFYNGGGIRITVNRKPDTIRFKMNCQKHQGNRGKSTQSKI